MRPITGSHTSPPLSQATKLWCALWCESGNVCFHSVFHSPLMPSLGPWCDKFPGIKQLGSVWVWNWRMRKAFIPSLCASRAAFGNFGEIKKILHFLKMGEKKGRSIITWRRRILFPPQFGAYQKANLFSYTSSGSFSLYYYYFFFFLSLSLLIWSKLPFDVCWNLLPNCACQIRT